MFTGQHRCLEGLTSLTNTGTCVALWTESLGVVIFRRTFPVVLIMQWEAAQCCATDKKLLLWSSRSFPCPRIQISGWRKKPLVPRFIRESQGASSVFTFTPHPDLKVTQVIPATEDSRSRSESHLKHIYDKATTWNPARELSPCKEMKNGWRKCTCVESATPPGRCY